MFNKDDYVIKIKNSERIELKGYFSDVGSDECLISFCGFGGNCDEAFCAVAEECIKSNISFLFGNTQGSYDKKELKQYDENNNSHKVLKGAFNEDFDKCINDMHLWVEFALQKGYKKIHLLGASLACNRIVKYLNTYQYPKELDKVILHCPQNLHPQIDEAMLNEAKKLIKEGRTEELLSEKLFGYFDVCARTFHNIATNNTLDNLPYIEDGDFSYLENINNPVRVIIGSLDNGIVGYTTKTADELMNVLKLHNSNLEYFVIEGAKHNFKHFETILAQKTVQYIKNGGY